MVEPMIKEALIRLNPEIAEEPSRADEVIYKLRTIILSVQANNLITQNELFKKKGPRRKFLPHLVRTVVWFRFDSLEP